MTDKSNNNSLTGKKSFKNKFSYKNTHIHVESSDWKVTLRYIRSKQYAKCTMTDSFIFISSSRHAAPLRCHRARRTRRRDTTITALWVSVLQMRRNEGAPAFIELRAARVRSSSLVVAVEIQSTNDLISTSSYTDNESYTVPSKTGFYAQKRRRAVGHRWDFMRRCADKR